ncbi:MAG: hypothetical protein IIC07_00480 [Proteobacteria bacterium]|nr:hypothetical protein [Pseudomonadota bacterium]
MSEAQAAHLQSLTTALGGMADAVDAMIGEDFTDANEDAVERARDIARRVLGSESYDMAADAVRADWAAAGGGPIEDVT